MYNICMLLIFRQELNNENCIDNRFVQSEQRDSPCEIGLIVYERDWEIEERTIEKIKKKRKRERNEQTGNNYR